MLSGLPAVDITVFHNGFHGDLNETFFVGDVDEEAKKLVQTTYECLMQAIDSGTGRLAPSRSRSRARHHVPTVFAANAAASHPRSLSAPQ